MKKTALLTVYGAAWRLARPLLKRHKRLAVHFNERLVPPGWPQDPLPPASPPTVQPPFRLWLHAASGGEAYLARELLRELAPQLPKLGVLCTAMTQQGVEVLARASQEFSTARSLIAVNYFPLDEPELMRRALARLFGPPSQTPCAVVLLETELWPGLLWACRACGVHSYILNGRMTPSSFKAYGRIKGLLRSVAPEEILATSPDDAARFSAVFDEAVPARVTLMPNIKFDRVFPVAADRPNALRGLVEAAKPQIVLLASVREEEEPQLQAVIQELRTRRPQACIIVAPRHLQRAEAWRAYLSGLSDTFKQRSQGIAGLAPGDLALWDSFGELFDLYGLAEAVFVGGSLAPLGGQNFLEPLSFGLRPVIGPSWSNFYWVGREPFELGLVQQVKSGAELAEALLARLDAPSDKERTQELFSAYLSKHQGGSRLAAEFLLKRLQLD